VAQGLKLLSFECTACGNCCRHVRVPLTHCDLSRLRRFTGLPAEDHIDWLHPQAIDMTGEPETVIELDIGRRVQVLSHRAQACRFLDEQGRCTTYQARPTSCRTFPISASFGRRGGIRRLRLLPLGDCPWRNGPRADARALLRLHAQERQELSSYAELVQHFNRKQNHRRRLSRRLLGAAAWLRFLARHDSAV
jgi:Fe-S-cluster containining protein